MKRIKIIIALSGLLMITGFLFSFGLARAQSTDAGLVSDSPITVKSSLAIGEGLRIIQTLQKIKGLSLDYSLLDKPAFRSLKESKVQPLTLSAGRSNPFAPLGFMTGNTSLAPVVPAAAKTVVPAKTKATTPLKTSSANNDFSIF